MLSITKLSVSVPAGIMSAQGALSLFAALDFDGFKTQSDVEVDDVQRQKIADLWYAAEAGFATAIGNPEGIYRLTVTTETGVRVLFAKGVVGGQWKWLRIHPANVGFAAPAVDALLLDVRAVLESQFVDVVDEAEPPPPPPADAKEYVVGGDGVYSLDLAASSAAFFDDPDRGISLNPTGDAITQNADGTFHVVGKVGGGRDGVRALAQEDGSPATIVAASVPAGVTVEIDGVAVPNGELVGK